MVSGINHGVNVGRSVLHSGTVGVALTVLQLGISALAVSLRSGTPPAPWESAADLAIALLPLLAAAPTSTVLNLNVPSLPLHEILGLRWARVGGSGLIKAAAGSSGWDTPNQAEMEGPAAAEAAQAVMEDGQAPHGEIVLSVGSPFPRSGEIGLADPNEDATLVARGYAVLTALQGPRADEDPEPSASSTSVWRRPWGRSGWPAEPWPVVRPHSSPVVGRPPAALHLRSASLVLYPADLRTLGRPRRSPLSDRPSAPPPAGWPGVPGPTAGYVPASATRTQPPGQRVRSVPKDVARCRGPSTDDPAISNWTSTRLSVRLAC